MLQIYNDVYIYLNIFPSIAYLLTVLMQAGSRINGLLVMQRTDLEALG